MEQNQHNQESNYPRLDTGIRMRMRGLINKLFRNLIPSPDSFYNETLCPTKPTGAGQAGVLIV